MSIVETDPYSVFLFGMRSASTREKVIGRLRMFFDFVGIERGPMEGRCKAFFDNGHYDKNLIFSNLIRYLQFHKDRAERKEISSGTVKNYYQAVKLFCEMNQIELPWKRISRALPKVKRYADDRAPTIEEIRSMCDYPDRRIKPIIYLMTSSGIRLGAWDYIKWKHIVPISRDDKIVGAKLIVYPQESEEYFTFITSEAYHELKKWMDYRKQCGEEITSDSWLMRNRWDKKKGYARGLISIPIQLKSVGVKRIIEDALWTQAIRKKLVSGRKRHEFQADHGFRKWFKTRCELSGMKSINIENLMGHNRGISDSYYRPTEKEFFDDYLKAVEFLTIETENVLKNKLEEISGKSDKREIILESKMLQKDERITEMEKKLSAMESMVLSMVQSLASAPENEKNLLAKHLFRNQILQMNESQSTSST